ncbi:LCP family protein [Lacrimispora celerecrescens]|uniref:Transcriptional regulator n=1 Tax=Lacrimispora celerecrescens TaxID=29354 RepID=A0A084JMV8_9FIRM|nr:LCP family protein [Lacrimispora celerecrescens]KEZ90292.1 transcriptional regulator [Lacrimispora celerecrescens]MBW4845796.1 LCP family protein [Lachnospiraceae bacterium]
MTRQHLKWGLIMIAAVWAALIGTMLGYAWNIMHMPNAPKVQMPQLQNTNISIETQEKMEGYWTVAVFGVDSREGTLGKGTRSDMQMILNVDLGTGEIRIVSVYRDTYLRIDDKERYDKINEAYFRGGPKQAIEALKDNLDLTIDDYASFSWKAVADAINLLGGIDVDISHEEFRVINGFITETVESTGVGSHHLKKEGPNHLDGVQAVAYARLRKMDTDFKRTERQREVVDLALKKAREADAATLSKVAAAVFPQISTSVGMKDILPLMKNIKRFHMTDTEGFPSKLKDVMIGKRDCVVPVTLESNVIRLHQFLFDDEIYEPSDTVKEISRQIELRIKNKK